jgi:hypothetical protein
MIQFAQEKHSFSDFVTEFYNARPRVQCSRGNLIGISAICARKVRQRLRDDVRSDLDTLFNLARSVSFQ